MQLALAAGSTPDRGTVSAFLPTSRTNLVLAAGVALAAAGVIAVNPVAPMLSLDAQQTAVQLTSTWDTAADNWANLQELISTNPDPIGNALGDLFTSYSTVASDSLENSAAGIEGIWSGLGGAKGLETILPLITQYLQDGNATDAFNLINKDMLFNMQNIFQPLFNHVPHGETEEVAGLFGLGNTMLRDW
ncbi:MAG TPA: hypothetical protein VFR27_17150, partial [Mycobacterium sp.]|nr:hypothetical protein [Mycobacterium sp.]